MGIEKIVKETLRSFAGMKKLVSEKYKESVDRMAKNYIQNIAKNREEQKKYLTYYQNALHKIRR